MSNLCPNCGYTNRPGAKFCATCGYRMPTIAPAPLSPAALTPLPAAPATPLPTPAAPPGRSWLQRLLRPDPLVAGRVLIDPIERYENPPTDWGRVLLLAALVAAFVVPFLLHPEAIAQLFWAVVIFLAFLFLPMLVAGMAGFRSVAPMLNPLTWFSVGSSLVPRGGGRAQARSEAPHYSFKVEDAQTGRTVGVQMIGRRKGGDISLGDEVQVWGRLDRAHSVIRAHAVRIDTSMGAPAGYKVSAARETPLWIGPVVGALLLAATFLTS